MTTTTRVQEPRASVETLPISIESRRRYTESGWGLAPIFSGALAAVAAVTAAVGVFFPSVFNDAPMTAGNARGTDLVILAVAIPILLAGMLLTRRNVLWGRVLWLGSLAYLTYNAIFFAYAIHFNRLFLLYALTLALAVWSVVTCLQETRPGLIRDRIAGRLPVRAISGYLLLTTALFAALWLKDILPAVWNGVTPVSLKRSGMVTNAIQMTDLAFGFPLAALAAVWLWQRRAWGYVLAGAFLVYGAIEAISVASDQYFGHMNDPQQSTAAIPIFIVLALIGLVPLAVYIRAFQQPGPHSGRIVMKLLLGAIASALVLGMLLATVGGVPVSSVLAFSMLTALLFATVFIFDLT